MPHYKRSNSLKNMIDNDQAYEKILNHTQNKIKLKR